MDRDRSFTLLAGIGKRDIYPTEGRFRTSAMAEGAIEGSAEQYELPFGNAVDFAFSRFYSRRPADGLLLAAGEASAVDEGGEASVSVSSNANAAGSGRPSRRLSENNGDCDSDGIPDAEEGTVDTDSDGIPDYTDPDSDGDSIPDAEEGTVDTDSDGIPDATDPDSDGDSIPDAEEGSADTDSDGIPDFIDPDSRRTATISPTLRRVTSFLGR